MNPKHSWQCIAPSGHYFWSCSRCGATVPYPVPTDRVRDFNTPCSHPDDAPSAPIVEVPDITDYKPPAFKTQEEIEKEK